MAGAADALLQLHSGLKAALPELLQVQRLIQASVEHNKGTSTEEVVQRQLRQCRAVVTVLQSPLNLVAGQEQQVLQELLQAKAFIEEGVATLRIQQSLLELLDDNMNELPSQPSLGTTERAWQQHGVQLAPRRVEQDQALTGPSRRTFQPLQHPHPMRQQQQQQQQPAPLGLALLMQQEAEEKARAAAAAATAAAANTSAELTGTQSVEMLPLAASISMVDVPTLSQLLEEPMLTLSIKDEAWEQAAALAAAAVEAAAGAKAAAEDAGGIPTPSVPTPPIQPAAGGDDGLQEQQTIGNASLDVWMQQLPLGGQLSSMLLEQLLLPMAEGSLLRIGASLGLGNPAKLSSVRVGPSQQGAHEAAAGRPGAQQQPIAAQQQGCQAAAAAPGCAQHPMQQQHAAGPAAAPLQEQSCMPGPSNSGGHTSPFLMARRGPPLEGTHAQQAPAGQPYERSSSSSPANSSDQQQQNSSNNSGSLSYRRVSFVQVRRCTAQDEGRTPSSAQPTAASMPFLARPPPVLAAGSNSMPLAVGPQPHPLQPPVAAPGPAPAVPASCAVPPPPPHLVLANAPPVAVHLAAPQAAHGAAPHEPHIAAATADGLVSYVSVQPAGEPHDFSAGENSLSKLFYQVHKTGELPQPSETSDSG